MAVAPAGWTTYQLSVDLPAGAANIYALAGTPSHAVGLSAPLGNSATVQLGARGGGYVCSISRQLEE